MLLTEAKPIAEKLKALLEPYCDNCEIAGSIRRKNEFVGDIELCIVIKPNHYNKLFNYLGLHLLKLNKDFRYMKNGDKYKQFMYEGVKVDLFIAQPDNWGLIFMIRTGSADFSKLMLQRWKYATKGGYSEEGYLYTKDGTKVLTPDEETVFRLCKTRYLEPEKR